MSEVQSTSSVCAVKVYTRVRPVSEIEKKNDQANPDKAYDEHIEFLDDGRSITTQSGHAGNHTYTFDGVLGKDYSQEEVYKTISEDFTDDMLQGYNCTIFAYGQTGAGKSYTMFGPAGLQQFDAPEAGLIPRSIFDVFMKVQAAEKAFGYEYEVSVSYLQIYQEAVQDLLKPKNTNLRVRESPTEGVVLTGDENLGCNVSAHCLLVQWLKMGSVNRTFAQTACNETSSRSHTLFMVTLTEKREEGSTRQSKLCLADLAGSEKVGKSLVQGEQFVQAVNINQSLTSLGHCIFRLTGSNSGSSAKHVPYRDSKLTFILKDSLGGNSKTALICAVSPHLSQFSETVSTLQFAERAKKIQNSVSVKTIMSHSALVSTVEKLETALLAAHERLEQLEAELGYRDVDTPSSPEVRVSSGSMHLSQDVSPVSSPIAQQLQGADAEDVDNSNEQLAAELEQALDMVKAVGQQNKVLANEARAAAQLQAEADKLASAAMTQNELLKTRVKDLEVQVTKEREIAVNELQELHANQQLQAQEAVEKTKSELRKVQGELQAKSKELVESQESAFVHAKKVSEMESRSREAEEAKSELEKELAGIAAERDALCSERDELQASKNDLTDQLNRTRIEGECVDKGLSEQVVLLQSELQVQKTKFHNDLKQAKKEMSAHSKSKGEKLTKELQRKDEQLQALRDELALLVGQHEETRQRAASVAEDERQAASDVETLKTNLKDAQERITAIEAERCRTASDLSDTMQELTKLKAELQEQTDANTNQRNELLRMRKVVSNVLEEKKAMEDTLLEDTNTTQTIEMLRQETKRLQESSEQAHEEAVQAHKAKDELSATLEALEANFIRKIQVTSRSSNLSAYFPSPRSSDKKKGKKGPDLAKILGVKSTDGIKGKKLDEFAAMDDDRRHRKGNKSPRSP